MKCTKPVEIHYLIFNASNHLIRMLRSLALILFLAATSQTTQSIGHSTVDKEVREVFPGVGEYYFSGIAANWTEAYKQCKSSGGHLAIISSPAEVLALKQMMVKFNASAIHLGVHDLLIEGDFTTILGMPVPSECGVKCPYWAANNPKSTTSYNCGGFSYGQGMIDTTCGLKNVFICELTEEQTPADGYERIEGHGSYKYHDTYVSWPTAWSTCRSEQAHLLIVNSPEEVSAIIQKYTFPVSWVGVHRLYGGNNDFVTVFDERLEDIGFSTWHSNYEPYGNFVEQPYAALHGIGTLFMSYSLTNTFHFICERD